MNEKAYASITVTRRNGSIIIKKGKSSARKKKKSPKRSRSLVDIFMR